MRTVTTSSESETIRVGEELGATLSAGDIVLLFGSLGAGKTAFVRGLAGGVGADPDQVTSPTFALVQEYRGRFTLYHVDLYRLEPRDVDELGLDELAVEGAVAIEWADRLPRSMAGAIDVRIEDAGDDARSVTILQPIPINCPDRPPKPVE